MKACTYAYGQKQREDPDYNKGDNANPTVSTEEVMLTAVTEAKEGKDVSTVDLPNFFKQTPQPDDDKVVIHLRGRLAELMVLIASELYTPFVILENGKKVLYVQLLNALYGTLKAALLSYMKLRKDLEEDGFIINPYDMCVAKKLVDGKQMTVVWYVDDLKLSHICPQEVSATIEFLCEHYEDENGKLKVTRGKIHYFLGMTLDYTTPGEVKIKMINYVKKMIREFPVEIKEAQKTPAAEHLFKVNEQA